MIIITSSIDITIIIAARSFVIEKSAGVKNELRIDDVHPRLNMEGENQLIFEVNRLVLLELLWLIITQTKV